MEINYENRDTLRVCPECGNTLILYDGIDFFCPDCDYTYGEEL